MLRGPVIEQAWHGRLSPKWMSRKLFRAGTMSSDAACAWVLTRALGSVLVALLFHCAANVGQTQTRLTVDSCRVASVKGRKRPLLSASVRQYGKNVT